MLYLGNVIGSRNYCMVVLLPSTYIDVIKTIILKSEIGWMLTSHFNESQR